jgi:hypothetical protein
MSEPKITKAQIQEFLDDFHERISAFDLIATAVLKSHLEVEILLNAALDVVAKNPKHLDGKPSFFKKVKLLRAFGPLGDDKRWQLVLALNELRNQIAHKPDGPERKKAMLKLRNELGKLASGPVGDERKTKDYNVVLLSAIHSNILIFEVRERAAK